MGGRHYTTTTEIGKQGHQYIQQGPTSPQLHLETNKSLRFIPREVLSQISWVLEVNDDPTTTSQLVATIVSATDGQQRDIDEKMFDQTAQQLKATASMPTAAGSSQQDD